MGAKLRINQQAAIGFGKWFDVVTLIACRALPALLIAGPIGDQDYGTLPAQFLDQMVEQHFALAVEPVQVLHHQKQLPRRRNVTNDSGNCFNNAPSPRPRRQDTPT